MKTTHLYNTAHPLGASGKPIFIPFGEWAYDGTTRQRLDREHAEKIAGRMPPEEARGAMEELRAESEKRRRRARGGSRQSGR